MTGQKIIAHQPGGERMRKCAPLIGREYHSAERASRRTLDDVKCELVCQFGHAVTALQHSRTANSRPNCIMYLTLNCVRAPLRQRALNERVDSRRRKVETYGSCRCRCRCRRRHHDESDTTSDDYRPCVPCKNATSSNRTPLIYIKFVQIIHDCVCADGRRRLRYRVSICTMYHRYPSVLYSHAPSNGI